MAAARGGGIGPRGILRMFGRLALFLGLGFAAGLFFGVVTEEPALLAGHLQDESETESYSLPTAGTREEFSSGEDDQAARANELDGSQEQPAAEPPLAAALRLEAERESLSDVQSERMALQAEAAPAARLPVVAAPARLGPGRPASLDASDLDGPWAIQVGAFSDRAAAEALARSLATKNYPVDLVPSAGGPKQWRVRVQPLEGKARAEKLADRLKQKERLPTWLIPFEASERR